MAPVFLGFVAIAFTTSVTDPSSGKTVKIDTGSKPDLISGKKFGDNKIWGQQ